MFVSASSPAQVWSFMESSMTARPEAASAAPSVSLARRSVAIFVRPDAAWEGLGERVQWWFPVVVLALTAAGIAALLHQRAMLPMLSDNWRDQVANGVMPADQARNLEAFFGSTRGLLLGAAQQCVVVPAMVLLTGLAVWFGVGFVLGRSFPFRLALEVAAWSSLVTIPAQLITAVLAWSRETLRGIHVGFGLLVPMSDPPSRLGIWLGAVLDGVGPLAIWYVVVLVLGAAALSGAPRRSVAWVLGSLYLVLVLFVASMGALIAPLS